ncbi:Rmf/CrpP family protein [uncultured Sphingomonas sp.]|uniref:ribosome modulation factor n=1 Tax=uncultured Sphingomonas sp. TaxID=158754 RepID=UPI00345C6F73
MANRDDDGSPQRVTDALLAGRDAFAKGDPISACPFNPNTAEYDAWRRGYRNAYFDVTRKSGK